MGLEAVLANTVVHILINNLKFHYRNHFDFIKLKLLIVIIAAYLILIFEQFSLDEIMGNRFDRWINLSVGRRSETKQTS